MLFYITTVPTPNPTSLKKDIDIRPIITTSPIDKFSLNFFLYLFYIILSLFYSFNFLDNYIPHNHILKVYTDVLHLLHSQYMDYKLLFYVFLVSQ